MDGNDWQADSADASRRASESAEPVGSAASSDQGVIDGTVGLSEHDAVFVEQWDKLEGEAGMGEMFKDLFGARIVQLGLLVLVIALVAGYWWQGREPSEPGAGGLDPVAGTVENGIESATYSQPGEVAVVDGSEPASVARPPLDGSLSAVGNAAVLASEDDLRAIPQSEPEPLAEPPAFDSPAPISRAPSLPGNTDGFPRQPETVSTVQHPLAEPDNPGFATPLGAEAESIRPLELPGATTSASPPPTRPRLTTGSDDSDRSRQYSEKGVGDDVGLSRPESTTGPRSLEPSGQAHPIVSDTRQDPSFVSSGSASASLAQRVHAVRSGDSYWTISRQHYGSARYFQALSAFNRKRIPDPRKMRPGMKVLVPSRELLETRFAALLPTMVAEPGAARTVGFQIDVNGHPVYAVGSDDTLTGIARIHLGRTSRWIQIYRMNRDQLPSPHKLKLGTVLRMPADAARLQGDLR